MDNIIDIQRLRDALPNRAIVSVKNLDNDKDWDDYIEFIINPSLIDQETDDKFQTLIQVESWQEEIIGKHLIIRTMIESLGSHWKIYLKNEPILYINVANNDIIEYKGKNILI